MPTLAAPPVSALFTERKTRELLNEFTLGWFDGAEHDTPLQDEPVAFPECAVAFGQSYPREARPLIHYVFASLTPDRDWVRGDAIAVTARLLLNVFIRVPTAGSSGQRADNLASNVADLWRMLMDCAELRAPLAQKGLHRMTVLRGPVPLTFPGYQVRLIVAKAELNYELPGVDFAGDPDQWLMEDGGTPILMG